MKDQILPTIAGLIVLILIGWYIDSIAHDQIVSAVRFTIWTIAIVMVIAVVSVVIGGFMFIRERFLTERANRRYAEREADVFYITAREGEQVLIRDMNPKATWRNATLDARIVANGRYNEPTEAELTVWQTYHQLRSRPSVAKTIDLPMLPAQTQMDLLAALDSVQRCLIVGASDTGKTTLLQHIISRRLQSSKVIVIDPHAFPEKWPGECSVMGTGRNYAEVGKALDALVQLMTKRYGEIGKGLVAEMAHPKVTIVIDEWRAIVYNVKDSGEAIKALLTESRKAAFSVFVATHSERVKALGIEGEGDLKDGFAVVRLSLVNGQRQATIDKGNGEIPATLPGPYHGYGPKVLEHDLIDFDPRD